ncbi:MAG: hypothetical protein ACRCS0_05315 [Albidovulum sp.]
MPAPKLMAIVTALILMSGHGTFAEYSLSQLQEIERYILTKNTAALLLLLQANPELLVGDDPLAVELRAFMANNLQQQFLWFNAPTATLPPADLALGHLGGDNNIY